MATSKVGLSEKWANINSLSKLEILKRISINVIGKVLNLIAALDHLFAKNDSMILESRVLPLDISTGDIFIYGTYNKNNQLRKEEFKIIRQLSKLNYVLVVQNGTKIDPLILNLSCSYILRKNIGRDIGMLRDAIQILMIPNDGRNLIWMNSSCNWEFNKLKAMINSERKIPTGNVVAMTDSWRGGFHLQSFFFFVHSEYKSNFAHFFSSGSVKNWRYKRTAVQRGEKALSKFLLASNLKLAAFFPVKNYSANQFKYVTSYLDFKFELLRDGAPFSKL